MPAAAKSVDTSQYERANKRAVTTAHRSIETAAIEALSTAGHKAPKKLAKVVRAATDVLDEFGAAELEVVLERPAKFEEGLKKAIAELLGETKRPRRRSRRSKKKSLSLGEAVNDAPLSDRDAALPFTDDVETVGEDDPFYETLSTTEASDILDISRTTAIQWIEGGKLIGLKGAKRGWRIPKAQIRRGRLAPGLEDVSKHFDDPEEAWHFLVSEMVIDSDRGRPLDLLFKKKADLVVKLAESFGRDFL